MHDCDLVIAIASLSLVGAPHASFIHRSITRLNAGCCRFFTLIQRSNRPPRYGLPRRRECSPLKSECPSTPRSTASPSITNELLRLRSAASEINRNRSDQS